MKKQSFLYGSFILIVSVVITKVIGAVFRIPLANLLGGVGMGYYFAAYGIFMPVYAVTAAGLPAAVAKIVAENAAAGHFANIRKIKRISLIAFTLAGLFFTAVSIPAAFLFVKISDNPSALLAVLTILPAILFGSVSCVLRGYYEGLRNMLPTAISQVIEAVAKLVLGLALTVFVLDMPAADFTQIFGETSRLAAAAAAGVAGVTISSAVAVIFLLIRGKFDDKFVESDKTTQTAKEILSPLLKTAVPIALGALVTNLTSLIDIVAVIPSLKAAIETSIVPFMPIMHAGVKKADLAPFIFGSFTGLAVTVFTLIPSFTNMFGKSALPLIVESVKEKTDVSENVGNVIFTAAAVAAPGGVGIALLSSEILEFLFPARAAEIAVAALPLSVLGFAVIFLCISSALFTVLQAASRADIPLKIMLAGVALKLALNLTLVRIPEIGVTGAAIATLACYILIFVLSMVFTVKITKVKHIGYSLAAIAVSSALCGIAAKSAMEFLPVENKVIHLFVSIGIAGLVYVASLYLTQKKQLLKLLRNC
ncbi:MAG: polysaccharide biosynthesis C-terminal domain-containing protein [Ruminococcus sp.]|jgi:stage V sporulation protein B|nr:polysaccharide biosynthesis C-terminal domain-containing protein [Ruminococcus sp.]